MKQSVLHFIHSIFNGKYIRITHMDKLIAEGYCWGSVPTSDGNWEIWFSQSDEYYFKGESDKVKLQYFYDIEFL